MTTTIDRPSTITTHPEAPGVYQVRCLVRTQDVASDLDVWCAEICDGGIVDSRTGDHVEVVAACRIAGWGDLDGPAIAVRRLNTDGGLCGPIINVTQEAWDYLVSLATTA